MNTLSSGPVLPFNATAVTFPTVIGYQNHLIIAGGQNSKKPDVRVNILDITKNWKTAQSLPRDYCRTHYCTDYYSAVIIQDTVYLVGWNTQSVLRAHMPKLILGAKSGVWETISNTPYYHSSPVTIGNALLIVGGSDKSQGGNSTTSIQMYNPNTKQWTRVGDLPEPMNETHCVIMNSELFVFGFDHYVIFDVIYAHISKLTVMY